MSKGGGSKGSSTTQTIQNSDPWSGVQPYLKTLYQDADRWLGSGTPSYYPHSTVADQSTNTRDALNRGLTRALAGSPLERIAQQHNLETTGGKFLVSNPANGYLRGTANGELIDSNPSNPYFEQAAGGGFVGSNPYLDQMYASATNPLVNQYKNAIAPGLASQFSAAGRMGSGSHLQAIESSQEPLAQGLASAASSIYGNAYENERARQQQAAQILSGNQQFERNLQQEAAKAYGTNYNFERGLQETATQMAPQLANIDWANIEKEMGIGQYYEDRAQNQIDADIARWDFGQNSWLNKLQAYNALIQGGTQFGSSSTTQKASQARNPFLGAVGGAFAGNALGGAVGGAMGGAGFGPIGMGLGALLGGLYG